MSLGRDLAAELSWVNTVKQKIFVVVSISAPSVSRASTSSPPCRPRRISGALACSPSPRAGTFGTTPPRSCDSCARTRKARRCTANAKSGTVHRNTRWSGWWRTCSTGARPCSWRARRPSGCHGRYRGLLRQPRAADADRGGVPRRGAVPEPGGGSYRDPKKKSTHRDRTDALGETGITAVVSLNANASNANATHGRVFRTATSAALTHLGPTRALTRDDAKMTRIRETCAGGENAWAAYPLGVLAALEHALMTESNQIESRNGRRTFDTSASSSACQRETFPGFGEHVGVAVLISSAVPEGAGVSSSAALETAVAHAACARSRRTCRTRS